MSNESKPGVGTFQDNASLASRVRVPLPRETGTTVVVKVMMVRGDVRCDSNFEFDTYQLNLQIQNKEKEKEMNDASSSSNDEEDNEESWFR
jgi:hypothetical protein